MTTPPTQQEYNQYLHSDTDVSWISVEAVTNTIKNLQPQKAAGQAQITWRMLQNLPTKVIYFLTNVYQSVIKLEYVPNNWCESKAIFIPKNNKLPKN